MKSKYFLGCNTLTNLHHTDIMYFQHIVNRADWPDLFVIHGVGNAMLPPCVHINMMCKCWHHCKICLLVSQSPDFVGHAEV